MNTKKTILIVDDSELNRALLEDMLSADYDILEAENGLVASRIIQEHEMDICLMLLDIVMPVMDGFGLLKLMNKKGWIKHIPVIMISAETASTFMDKAYGLGAVEYISRPFDERTVRHRVDSNVILGEKQRDLSSRLAAQIYEKEKDNRLMIEILSHIVEFRNGESGLHVLHVHAITEFLLQQLAKTTDKYDLSPKRITLISNASALHDVGKITIPSEILNKEGKLTAEEYEIMKSHTLEGAKMLEDIPFRSSEPLIKESYEICRWHHERFDGSGYPDGLKGEEIPISAQVVALADVYDALTSRRVYKPSFPHEQAVNMILKGECGAFNPLLLDCFKSCHKELERKLKQVSFDDAAENDINNTLVRTLKNEGTEVSNRTIKLLEHERNRFKILSSLSREVIFEYNAVPEMITFSDWCAEFLGLPVTIYNPADSEFGKKVFAKKDFKDLIAKIKATSPENPSIIEKYLLDIKGAKTWCKVYVRTMWNDNDKPELEGAIGKIVDVNEEINEIKYLETEVEKDFRTGLLNYRAAKQRINDLLANAGKRKFALIMFDMDNLKQANDTRGHLFGDEVIEHIAKVARENTRDEDIVARIGGDEFIIFMEYKRSIEAQIKRIFKCLTQEFTDFKISVSMGIACTEGGITDYERLFARADTAAYAVKKSGKNAYRFYDETMKNILK
ncbi:MAG: diguanylate cyclase [Clostridia bacterium]|nr:diguanylate cyclase [Clostridia bacterium]